MQPSQVSEVSEVPEVSEYPVPKPPSETLPTMYDLPSEYPEELGLPDEFHEFQPELLRKTCQPTALPIEQTFVGTDLNVYYDVRHSGWHKRPDWFLVLGVERARQQSDLRWSYVIWQEAAAPFLVVELLSPGTEAEDMGQTLRDANKPPTKWQVYEQVLRIPYYVIYDRYENDFRLYQLVGTRYQRIELPEKYYWFEEVGLGLGVWQGEYEGVEGKWLRWQDKERNWVPTPEERANQEQMRADQEQMRAERLAAKLRELGVNPNEIE